MYKLKQFFLDNSLILLALLISFNAFAAVAGPVSHTDLGSYYLGPEDVLEVSVWNEEKLTRTVLIRPDGRFSFPLAGEVKAAGKTPVQVRKEIENKLSKYIPDPVVTVMVTKVSSYKVYVIGQVKKSGLFVVGRPIDVMQALAMAGGLTPFAAEDDIKIIRNQKGKNQVLAVKYGDIKSGNNLGQIVTLQSGDVVIVP